MERHYERAARATCRATYSQRLPISSQEVVSCCSFLANTCIRRFLLVSCVRRSPHFTKCVCFCPLYQSSTTAAAAKRGGTQSVELQAECVGMMAESSVEMQAKCVDCRANHSNVIRIIQTVSETRASPDLPQGRSASRAVRLHGGAQSR